MRIITRFTVTACAFALAPIAHAACPYPDGVKVPDGATSTTEEMVAGQTRIKKYMAEMEAYLDCLDREERELGREPTPEEVQLHNQRHNAAVDEMEKVAADFNEQVRAYKKQDR